PPRPPLPRVAGVKDGPDERDWRQGFKVGSLVRKYEHSQSTISTILKSGDVVMKKAGTSGFDDQRKRLREALD
ncbi:unnamed protein product, partial [Ixodes pacificus]